MLQQHFIIEGKFRGTAERQFQVEYARSVRPASYSFFCPVCGEVWALCPVIGPEGTASRFQAMTRVCRKHPVAPFETMPNGTLHLSWDRAFSDAFPDDVVRWEFDRYTENL